MSTDILANANKKSYRLLSPDGSTYESDTQGSLGGYAPLRIYGRLDCWSANKHLRNGGRYIEFSLQMKRLLLPVASDLAATVCGISINAGSKAAFRRQLTTLG